DGVRRDPEDQPIAERLELLERIGGRVLGMLGQEDSDSEAGAMGARVVTAPTPPCCVGRAAAGAREGLRDRSARAAGSRGSAGTIPSPPTARCRTARRSVDARRPGWRRRT